MFSYPLPLLPPSSLLTSLLFSSLHHHPIVSLDQPQKRQITRWVSLSRLLYFAILTTPLLSTLCSEVGKHFSLACYISLSWQLLPFALDRVWVLLNRWLYFTILSIVGKCSLLALSHRPGKLLAYSALDSLWVPLTHRLYLLPWWLPHSALNCLWGHSPTFPASLSWQPQGTSLQHALGISTRATRFLNKKECLFILDLHSQNLLLPYSVFDRMWVLLSRYPYFAVLTIFSCCAR
jgi:hypothetical protein